jgi:hypothetical protein
MGSSPALAPGNGAGNTAAAISALKGMYPMAIKLLGAFPPGSDESERMTDIVKAMQKIVGKHQDESAVPAALQQMALANKAVPMKAAPPIAIQHANPQQPEEPETV